MMVNFLFLFLSLFDLIYHKNINVTIKCYLISLFVISILYIKIFYSLQSVDYIKKRNKLKKRFDGIEITIYLIDTIF